MLEAVSLEVTAEGIRRVTDMVSCRTNTPDFGGCDSEAADAKCSVNKGNGEYRLALGDLNERTGS